MGRRSNFIMIGYQFVELLSQQKTPRRVRHGVRPPNERSRKLFLEILLAFQVDHFFVHGVGCRDRHRSAWKPRCVMIIWTNSAQGRRLILRTTNRSIHVFRSAAFRFWWARVDRRIEHVTASFHQVSWFSKVANATAPRANHTVRVDAKDRAIELNSQRFDVSSFVSILVVEVSD